MKKKLLGLVSPFIMASQLTTAAYAMKSKILEFESDALSSKIWSGVPISKTRVEESLGFVEESDLRDPKYTLTQANTLEDFYRNITQRYSDTKFVRFAEICRKIAEESKEGLARQLAIRLLLEAVGEKYAKDLKGAEALRVRDERVNKQENGNSNYLDLLLNADRDIQVK